MSVIESISLFVIFVVLALVVDLLPFLPIIKKISDLSLNSMQTIKSNTLNDSEKEKSLLTNSASMFKSSLKLFGLVILLGVCTFLLLLPIVLCKVATLHMLLNHMAPYFGLLLAALAFIAYFLIKKIYVKIRL